MQLQLQVTAFVSTIDHIIPSLCSRPCTTKANAPIAIIRNVGIAIPAVLRVRMVSIACGKNPRISPMLAIYPNMLYAKLCSIIFLLWNGCEADFVYSFTKRIIAQRLSSA